MQSGFHLFGVPFEFVLFGATLLCVALFHHRTLTVAATGAAIIIAYKLVFTGIAVHMQHQWIELANLGLLLLGFALLSRHFEQSQLPELAPDILPDDWKGGL